jgi:Eco57I restriction-modification methylase
VNATELFEGISAIPGSQDAGSAEGMEQSRLVGGVEYARTAGADERKIRASWKKRQGGGATPLLLIADDPESDGLVRVLGPQKDGPLRRVRAEALFDLVQTSIGLSKLEGIRYLAGELERLDAEGVPGLTVRGLGTQHLFRNRLREQADRWTELDAVAAKVPSTGWREALDALGYEVSELPRRGYLAKAGGKPAIVIHPRRSADEFARLDEGGRLPEGALLTDCDANGAAYGILAAGSRMRLLRATGDDSGGPTRYLELDAAALEPGDRPLLGLLAPVYLVKGGFDEILREARDYGSELRERLDRALRERVLPILGRELGRWAKEDGRDVEDDAILAELEAAALTFVFRALFLLYAESANYLPMANHTYQSRSLTRIAQRAAEEQDSADKRSTSLWRDIGTLVDAMRTGQTAWGVPAYNGDLFAPDGFDGAEILEVASIRDAALAPALIALARDPERPVEQGVDFSGLEIGHLGHIYEGLLSLRLSVADRDYRYDSKKDRYSPDEDGDAGEPDVRRGDLFWLTNEGGRKGGGVYYTRAELVRHLVRRAVRPAFEDHLKEVRELAAKDATAAASKLFDFYVIDPACGSAHFLVEVVDELANQIATLLGELALPALKQELNSLRAAAGRALGVRIEDTALLKRLALKRCVYGVDLSPMGAEIAKVSLWLGAFVPGLSLAYLDHNVQVGNSLIGVARPDAIKPPGDENQSVFFGEALDKAVMRAAEKAAALREIDDSTPAEVDESRAAAAELHKEVEGARRVLDLWTAGALGVEGARDEALNRGDELIAGAKAELEEKARQAVAEQRALHWPLAFAEVFARENPGFDVIMGNPPWEEVNLDELTFYALYRPGLRSLPEDARLAALADLKKQRPELPKRVEDERARLARMRSYLGPDAGYRPGPGNADLYEYFCQRYQELLRPEGRLGVVLPRSVFLAKGSAEFRKWLFAEAVPERMDFLLNNGLWMFDTHPQWTVALLSAERREPSSDDALEVAGVARSAEEFVVQSTTDGLRLTRASLGPELEVPLLPNQRIADLLTKLRSAPAFPFGAGRWQAFPVQGDFNETSDRGLWQGQGEGWPLWKGGSFDQFDPHGAEARVCPPSKEALAVACKQRPGLRSLLAKHVSPADRRKAAARTVEGARVAFRDVTNRTNSRTVLACLVPPEHFLVNSAPYLVFVEPSPIAESACLALMNSLVFDWQARRFVEGHVNFFVLEGLKLPSLDDAQIAALAAPAARLSCPDERFADFAKATGVECGPLDEDERLALRADIDARVARAWDLTADELEIVFSDFTRDAVPEAYREAVRKRFAELG